MSSSRCAIGASGDPTSIDTAQGCHDAARAEGLTLKPQSAREKPGHGTGAKKKHPTGFVNVLYKASQNKPLLRPYFGKVRTAYLGYFKLPEQAALTVARYDATVELEVLATTAALHKGDNVRQLTWQEVNHHKGGNEMLRLWCSPRGLDTSGNKSGSRPGSRRL